MKSFPRWHLVLLIMGLLLVAGAAFAYFTYRSIYGPNFTWSASRESEYLYIPTGASFETVVDSLRPHLKNPESFVWVARKKNYPTLVRAGRFRLKSGWSNNALINRLRSGEQAPLDITLNQISSLSELAGIFGRHLEADSLAYLRYFQTEGHWQGTGWSRQEAAAVFLPNTYRFFWNTDPKGVLERMVGEAELFWAQRRDAAEALGMTPLEVVTLASIVEAETAQADEMPTVAGLYLNRLRQGIKLQADPTVIYGIQEEQRQQGIAEPKAIKRVLFRHLRHPSPYNTYRHSGLPPGPIRFPSVQAIEATLNYRKHNFIFMAADPERPGYHSFARNLQEHNRNRAKYIQWLNGQ